MGYELLVDLLVLQLWMQPNTVCTRLVGVGAFSGSWCGLSWFVKAALSRRSYQEGNASR